MVSVLITRPQATGELLAEALQERGYEGFLEPLLTIALTDARPPNLDALQAVMITSANALTVFKRGAHDLTSLLSMPCFCVGARTAAKARSYGFHRAESAAGDGGDLAELVAQTLKDKQKPILHIAGEITDSKATDVLQAKGFAVVTWVTYKALPAKYFTDHALRLLQQEKLDAVLFFSPRTAETFKTLIENRALEACCRHLVAIGLSEAVLKPLKTLPWLELRSAPVPTEEAVLECLESILPA